MPQPIQNNIDQLRGVIQLVAGSKDVDRGIRLGFAGDLFPRIAIHPDGTIYTGDGTVEPATPFTGGGGGTITSVNGQTGPTVTLAAADVGAAPSSHVTATTDVHGSASGSSKVAVIHTPAGTAENLYVDMESSPSTGQFAGDLRFIVPDGFFP